MVMHRETAPATPAERLKPNGQTKDNRTEADQTEDGVSRRRALIAIGKYAAYVTPAMTVLVRGSTALANHPCPNTGPPILVSRDDGVDPRRF